MQIKRLKMRNEWKSIEDEKPTNLDGHYLVNLKQGKFVDYTNVRFARLTKYKGNLMVVLPFVGLVRFSEVDFWQELEDEENQS